MAVTPPLRALVLICAIGVVGTLSVLASIKPTPGHPRDFYVARQIAPAWRLVVNGYLGQACRVQELGSLAWLVLPVAAILFARRRRLERPQVAVALGYGAIWLLIAAKGYYNPRYQITLLPITLGFCMCFLLTAQTSFLPAPPVLALALAGAILFDASGNRDRLRKVATGAAARSPAGLSEVMNRLPLSAGERFLVWGDPSYFQYFQRPALVYGETGIDMRHGPYYGVFAPGGPVTLSERGIAEVVHELRNRLKIRYVYLTAWTEQADLDAKRLVNAGATRIGDSSGFRLYELHPYEEDWLDPSHRAKIAGSSRFAAAPQDATALLDSLSGTDRIAVAPIAKPGSAESIHVEFDLGAVRRIGRFAVRFWTETPQVAAIRVHVRTTLQAPATLAAATTEHMGDCFERLFDQPLAGRYVRVEFDPEAGATRLLLRRVSLLEGPH